jgi:hypothetical protein
VSLHAVRLVGAGVLELEVQGEQSRQWLQVVDLAQRVGRNLAGISVAVRA